MKYLWCFPDPHSPNFGSFYCLIEAQFSSFTFIPACSRSIEQFRFISVRFINVLDLWSCFHLSWQKCSVSPNFLMFDFEWSKRILWSFYAVFVKLPVYRKMTVRPQGAVKDMAFLKAFQSLRLRIESYMLSVHENWDERPNQIVNSTSQLVHLTTTVRSLCRTP